MTPTRTLWCMITAFCLLPALTHAQGASEGLGKLLGAVEQYQQAKQDRQQAPGQSEGSSSGGGLPTQQIAACSEDIKRKQIESQSWSGDANAVAIRLGRYQKDLFEGRCAGHPEARAYIAGANKMLGYGGSATGGGGGSLPPLASTATGAGSPDHSRSRKVHNPAADAKSCTQLIEDGTRRGSVDLSGHWRFVNNCPTAVEFFWCSDAECKRGSGNTWTIGPGRGWPVSGTDVRWGACRGANSGGFDKGSEGYMYTCPNLKW